MCDQTTQQTTINKDLLVVKIYININKQILTYVYSKKTKKQTTVDKFILFLGKQ